MCYRRVYQGKACDRHHTVDMNNTSLLNYTSGAWKDSSYKYASGMWNLLEDPPCPRVQFVSVALNLPPYPTRAHY
uniref:Uncharacterized protein n=1 Tax=Rhizophora mucronata TaxID=61149 RepID=A0A2P2N7G9_RHIMU